MFVGHYGISFAVKSFDRRISLWLLFMAVQFVDVLWAIFVLLGIEKVRISPGITATNPLDLYYMPYTHSLVAALVWAGSSFIGYKFTRGSASRTALLVAAAVFSHWVLDLIVHRPDLPIYDNKYKLGLGVWNYPALAFALEAGLLFGGLILYLRASKPVSSLGRYGMPVFGILLLGLQGMVFFGAPPSSPVAAALTALVSYVLLAVIVFWLDRKRVDEGPIVSL
jgi:hypothetical protein